MFLWPALDAMLLAPSFYILIALEYLNFATLLVLLLVILLLLLLLLLLLFFFNVYYKCVYI